MVDRVDINIPHFKLPQPQQCVKNDIVISRLLFFKSARRSQVGHKCHTVCETLRFRAVQKDKSLSCSILTHTTLIMDCQCNVPMQINILQ